MDMINELEGNNKKFYRVSEVCEILGIFKNTLYNWEKQNKVPRARRDPMNGWRLYSQADVQSLIRLSGRQTVFHGNGADSV
jgi:DNA-binding transcriptional MerR regulator